MTNSRSKDTPLLETVLEWAKSLVFALFAAVFVSTFMYSSVEVQGNSMYPTLEDNDRLLIKKYEVLLKTEKYARGDIIVFEAPSEYEEKLFVKRVIGLPGDIVHISNGKVYVNDVVLIENYIESSSYTAPLQYGEDYSVGEHTLFVLGDNRFPGKSNDSRSFGSISFKKIKGKILFRYLPLAKFKFDL